MRIICACCGCAVLIDRDVPAACALCGRRAWQLEQPHRCEVSASDERYLKRIGIAWASREDG